MISILYTTATILFSAMVGLFVCYAIIMNPYIKFINKFLNYFDKYFQSSLTSFFLLTGLLSISISTLFYLVFFQ
jgi:hypothetical protein